MPKGLNKKILCFIDEYGTAGTTDLYLGAVMMLARDAGRVDKHFSDLLPESAAEVHATAMNDDYIKSLMQRFAESGLLPRIVMLNRKVSAKDTPGEAPLIYANAVVETTKIALRRFQQEVLRRETIGNVDLLLDVNHHNGDGKFDEVITAAQQNDGRFRAVTRFSKIDSAASRLLQLADVVAHSRKWIVREEYNAQGLRDRFGIEVSA